jgi:Meckel syndrome type 1 protein
MMHEPDTPERDPALDAAWREHSTEMPPAALDAAILAAAHRAVGSAPKDAGKTAAEATSPQRWWMPLAAAATIGAVALGILQTMPQQDSATTPAVTDAPAPARAPERASDAPSAPRDELQAASRKQAPAAVTVPAAPPAPASAPAKPAAKIIAPEAQIAASPAPQPFPAEKKAESTESDAKDRARMAPKLASAPLAAADVPPVLPAPMASGAVALGKNVARQDAAPAVDADAWIARIRKLHDEGKLADAAKELVAMRAAVPDADARLPRELRAWAATVKP